MCSSAIVMEPSWGNLESRAYLSASQVGIPVKENKKLQLFIACLVFVVSCIEM